MNNFNLTNNNFFSYEMYVELDMLCSLMFDWICGQVNITYIVTVDNGSLCDLEMKLEHEISQPTQFYSSETHRSLYILVCLEKLCK